MSRTNRVISPPGGTYRLGDRVVARIGFGAMQLAHLKVDLDGAVRLLRRAIDLGVDHIDTAQFYGDGFVNEVIRKTLRPGNDVVVASKVGADPDRHGQFPIKLAQRPEQLRASVESNLACLGLERISVVNLRRADVPPGLSPEGDQIVDLDDQLAEMIAMRDEGKIGAIGLSAVTIDGLKRALPAGIVCVQNAYSLISREFEEMLALCSANDIAWVPFFPLGGGFASFPKVKDHPTVIEIAARLSITPSQVGLAWLLAHSANILLIPGTANRDHLKQNVAVAGITLDEAAMAELDAVLDMKTPQ